MSSVQGDRAHGVADSEAPPVKVGGVADTGVRTAVDDGDRVAASYDEFGNARVVVVNPANGADISDGSGLDVDTELNAAAAGVDGRASPTTADVFAWQTAFDGTSGEVLRTPNVFKSVVATASGNTTLWQPAAGKKFRLLGVKVEVSQNATLTTTGAILSIDIIDDPTTMYIVFDVFLPTAADTSLKLQDSLQSIGNGILSSAADRAVRVNLSAGLLSGRVRVSSWGTEE